MLTSQFQYWPMCWRKFIEKKIGLTTQKDQVRIFKVPEKYSSLAQSVKTFIIRIYLKKNRIAYRKKKLVMKRWTFKTRHIDKIKTDFFYFYSVGDRYSLEGERERKVWRKKNKLNRIAFFILEGYCRKLSWILIIFEKTFQTVWSSDSCTIDHYKISFIASF